MNPEELLQIRGFDFKPEMYVAENGGQNEVWSGIIYSGNGSEKYEHELVHSYLYKLYRLSLHRLFDEGMATYLGGSSGKPYPFHRQKLKEYLRQHPETDLSSQLDPYQSLKIEEVTSLSYTTGALLCEYAYRLGGKEALLRLFSSGKEEEAFWAGLEPLELNKNNFNEKLRQLLKEEPLLIFN
jgi:hypothetical protein